MTRNLPLTYPSFHFADRCEVCYACIHNYPKKAIHVKLEKSSDRFRNEHIGLNEIIEANA